MFFTLLFGAIVSFFSSLLSYLFFKEAEKGFLAVKEDLVTDDRVKPYNIALLGEQHVGKTTFLCALSETICGYRIGFEGNRSANGSCYSLMTKIPGVPRIMDLAGFNFSSIDDSDNDDLTALFKRLHEGFPSGCKLIDASWKDREKVPAEPENAIHCFFLFLSLKDISHKMEEVVVSAGVLKTTRRRQTVIRLNSASPALERVVRVYNLLHRQLNIPVYVLLTHLSQDDDVSEEELTEFLSVVEGQSFHSGVIIPVRTCPRQEASLITKSTKGRCFEKETGRRLREVFEVIEKRLVGLDIIPTGPVDSPNYQRTGVTNSR